MKRIPAVFMSLLLSLVAYVLLAACAGARCDMGGTRLSGVPIILGLGMGYLFIWVVVYIMFIGQPLFVVALVLLLAAQLVDLRTKDLL